MSKNKVLVVKLFLFAIVVVTPTIAVMNLSFTNSIEYLSKLSFNPDVEIALKNNIKTMQRLRIKLTKKEQDDLHQIFIQDLDTLQAYSNLRQVREELTRELWSHTFLIGALASALSFTLAIALAKNIVTVFTALSKRLQDKERENAALAALENWQNVSRSVIHELRAGLTPIRLVSEKLGFSKIDNNSFQMANEIQSIILTEVSKMEELIENLTTFARLPNAVLEEQNLSETIDYFVKNFVLPEIHVKWDHGGDCIVSHDPSLIQRLLFNHLRNSREANIDTPGLEMVLTIELDQDSVTVHIKDNGRGIKEGQLTSIFLEKTSRIEKRADSEHFNRLPANMGLGLAINKKIALEHHGDLFAIQDENGAHFVLKIPIRNKEKQEV